MSPLLVLALLQGPLPERSTLKPMVVVTRVPRPEDSDLASGLSRRAYDPSAPGQTRIEGAAQVRARLLASGGYAVRDAGDFLLAAPPDLLGVPQARRETGLMRTIARLVAAGARVLAMKDLPPEEARALRSKLEDYTEPYNRRVRDAPYLRFGIATEGRFSVRSGRMSATLDLLPGEFGTSAEKEALKASVMRPDAEETTTSYVPPLPPLPAPSPEVPIGKTVTGRGPAAPLRGQLTFIVPKGLPGERGLEWIGAAQAILLKEARETRADWTQAHDALLAALRREADAAFAHPPTSGVTPTFDDLTPDAQSMSAQYFGAVYRNELKGQGAADWLHNAQTLDYRVEPVLTMNVGEGTGWHVSVINLECPVGP